jgi:[ribosomal protein S18]-alanine N-acetyltransferase
MPVGRAKVCSDSPVLRPIRWWDIPILAELERDLFGSDAWSEATWWAELGQQSAGRRYLLAESAAGEIIGYAGVQAAGPEADVMTIAVAAAGQRQGLGRRLLAELVSLARQAGSTALLLEVRADNTAAQGLYRAAGFERIAIRRGYYTNGGATDTDAWIMRRRPL